MFYLSVIGCDRLKFPLTQKTRSKMNVQKKNTNRKGKKNNFDFNRKISQRGNKREGAMRRRDHHLVEVYVLSQQ